MVGGPKNVPNAKNSNRQSILPGEKDQKHENRSFSMISRIPQLFILFAPENRFFVEVRISTKKLKADMPNFPAKMSDNFFQPDVIVVTSAPLEYFVARFLTGGTVYFQGVKVWQTHTNTQSVQKCIFDLIEAEIC